MPSSLQLSSYLRALCTQCSRISVKGGQPITVITAELSYCPRKHLLTTQLTRRRFFHVSSSCTEKQKRDLLKQHQDEGVMGNDATSPVKKINIEKPPSDLEIKRRLKPPKPVEENRESTLPTHDVNRITEESRKLERKANSAFREIAETRGATKETFIFAVKKFISKENVYWRGSVEFIYAGLHEMELFGVEKDLEAYKVLLQAFPEGKMIPRNAWQVEFMHYPRQQQCGIDMLEQMEHNAVIPDEEFGVILKNRFGREAHVTRKYRRMMYWLPKFKNINPYPIPMELPVDPRELALLALHRMNVDRETEYTVFETTEVDDDPEEDTFIASSQGPTQRRLLAEHPSEQPLFVEGPYPVYLREIRQNYFLLRAEPNINALMRQKEIEKEEENDENLFEWTNFFDEETSSALRPVLSVHEQDDSTVLALAITGTSSKWSAVTWVRCLQGDNPRLAHTPVLFKLNVSTAEGEDGDGDKAEDIVMDVIGDNRPYRDKVQERATGIADK